MGQIPVLGDVKADADGRRIIAADLEIDIAHRGIEGAVARIDDLPIRRHSSRWRLRHAVIPARGRDAIQSPSHEEKHATDSLLKPWGPVRQHEYRTFRAIADQPHARPDIDGSRDAKASLRNKEDSLAGCLLDSVDRGLNRRTIVGNAVALHRKPVRRQVNGLGIVQARRVVRCSAGGQAASQQDNSEHYEFPHRSPRTLVVIASSFYLATELLMDWCAASFANAGGVVRSGEPGGNPALQGKAAPEKYVTRRTRGLRSWVILYGAWKSKGEIPGTNWVLEGYT